MSYTPRSRLCLAAGMLRNAGMLEGLYGDERLPAQRAGESRIDYLVRFRVAPDAATAAEMLILAAGLTDLLNELVALENAGELTSTINEMDGK